MINLKINICNERGHLIDYISAGIKMKYELSKSEFSDFNDGQSITANLSIEPTCQNKIKLKLFYFWGDGLALKAKFKIILDDKMHNSQFNISLKPEFCYLLYKGVNMRSKYY